MSTNQIILKFDNHETGDVELVPCEWNSKALSDCVEDTYEIYGDMLIEGSIPEISYIIPKERIYEEMKK